SGSAPTISSLARAYDISFLNISRDISTYIYRDLESQFIDEAGRFKTWALNIGALQRPQSASSLDSRLRTANRMRENLFSLLQRLSNALARVNGIVLGDLPNRTNSPATEEDLVGRSLNLLSGGGIYDCGSTIEIVELFRNIRSCITNLFCFSTMLRRDHPRGRGPQPGSQNPQSDPQPYTCKGQISEPQALPLASRKNRHENG
ncbi:hypothetical protein BDP81DRAFT_486977, partial [Colletotrichum phormii]